jgi:hypothetical protein
MNRILLVVLGLMGQAIVRARPRQRVYVVVEGPDTSVVGISKNPPWLPPKLPSAQEFAAALNLAASHQA